MNHGESAHEGLPKREEYSADLGNAAIRAGEATISHPEYGLEMVPIEYKTPDVGSASADNIVDESDGDSAWIDTNRRLVRRNGDFVADVSQRFHLLPNEKVVSAANRAARDLGAVPFHEFDGDWYINLDDHVFQDADRHRVHALYAWDDPVDVSGDDEPEDLIQFGFAVHNSIDASMAFEVGLFTFRHACANMVTMGVDASGMSFDDREVVAHTKRAHTESLELNPDDLAAVIKNVMVFAEDIREGYEAWRDQIIDYEMVEGLIDRLPKKDLPDWIAVRDSDVPTVEHEFENARERKAIERHDSIADDEDLDLSDIDVTDVELSDEEKQSIVADHRPDDESVWETYNSVTESVWHDSGTGDRTKDRKFSKLHRVMEPAPGIR